MNYEQAQRVFSRIEVSVLRDLKQDLYNKAMEYAHIRAQYALADLEGKVALEDRRTRAHNAFIDACNILSRNMGYKSEDNEWRRELGEDRKLIGDFACYVHCILGIKAR